MYHSFQVITRPSLGFRAGEKVCLLGCPMAEAAAALGAADRKEKGVPPEGGTLHRYLVDGAELREDGSGRLAGARFLPRGGEAGGDSLGKADLLTPGGELIRGARPADIKAAYGEPAHTAALAGGQTLAYVFGGDVLRFDFLGGELDAVRLEAGGLNALKELLAHAPALPAAAQHPGARAADTTLAEKLTVAAIVMLVAYGLFQGIVRGIFSLIMRGNPENGVYVLFYGGGIVMLVAALIGAAAALLFWRRARRRGAGEGGGPWSALGSGLTMGLAVVAGAVILMLALFAWTFKAV